MFDWEVLRRLFAISCVGAAILVTGVFGNPSNTIIPTRSRNFVIHRLNQKSVFGETKFHKLHIRRTGTIPNRTYISIEDFTGQTVTLEGDDLSFTEARKTPENVVAIHITSNGEGLVEVSLIGDSANEITRFFHASGRQIRINIRPSEGSQRFNRDSYHVKKRTPYTKISHGDTQIGHSEDDVNDEYRARERYWWVLGHKFQDISIHGYISSTYAHDSIRAYPLIEIAGMNLKQEGSITGSFVPTFIIATIDESSGLPHVKVFEQKDDDKPILTVTGYAPLHRKVN